MSGRPAMTDADAFLAAIIARPDDDLPRLVFADYLEEAGDGDRAAFIRVQCELARLPAAHPDRSALANREAELLYAHKPEWVVPGLRGVQQFRRGFVEAVRTTARGLLAESGRLFAAAPVRELRVQGADAHAAALARLPALARVETLDLSNNGFGNADRLARFLADAPLAGLKSLTLRNNQVWPDAVQALARSPVAPQLERLDLSGNPIGDAGMDVLAGEPAFTWLAELTVRSDELHFSDCVHAAGAAALASSRTLNHLRRLTLAWHYAGDAGLIALVGSPVAAGLTHLDLSFNDIGSVGEAWAAALVTSPHLGSLIKLDLSGNRVTKLAAGELARWSELARGVRVDLRECELDEAGRAALQASPWADRFVLDPTAPA